MHEKGHRRGRARWSFLVLRRSLTFHWPLQQCGAASAVRWEKLSEWPKDSLRESSNYSSGWRRVTSGRASVTKSSASVRKSIWSSTSSTKESWAVCAPDLDSAYLARRACSGELDIVGGCPLRSSLRCHQI